MTLTLMPVLVGAAGLATEGVRWLDIHQTLQNAADSAAFSAALALEANQTSATQTQIATTQAIAVAATYCGTQGVSRTCFVDGQNGVTVNASLSVANRASYEATVTVTQQQSLLFSSYWLSTPITISATATAWLNNNTGDCLLALSTTGTGIGDIGNNFSLNLSSCSLFANSSASNALLNQGNNNSWVAQTIGTVGKASSSGNNVSFSPTPIQDAPAVADPYAPEASTWPSACSGSSCTVYTSYGTTLAPGVYPNGISFVGNNMNITLSPGIYYASASGFKITGNNITVNANGGVTLVLTGNSGDFSMTGNSLTINITAPTTGWSAGIAIWEPTSTTTNSTGNNSTLNINGVIYTPHAAVDLTGNNIAKPTCTQIVANTITFVGNNLSLIGGTNCNMAGMLLFGRQAMLVQ